MGEQLTCLSIIVASYAALLVPFIFLIGRFHRNAPYIRVVDNEATTYYDSDDKKVHDGIIDSA